MIFICEIRGFYNGDCEEILLSGIALCGLETR
jgi:hypothetical protein